ncbi:hypothetical protein [Altererythrobacter sp. GH1-8]|uniref:hypothetical protein n=1 Tax=Altererythrobacter sp. GH1-8 TaxID=3349333 RepID=UPI00374D85A9
MRVLNWIRAPIIVLAAAGLTACEVRETYSSDITEDEAKVIEAEIWAKEEAIFEGRGRGDLTNYLSVTSDSYLGWPPVMEKPLGLDAFRASASDSSALNGERVTLKREGFTLNGNTAAAYFTTHRTRLGDGFAPEGEREVDQYYENIHVWTLENGEWKLIGGMARLLPPAEGRISQDEEDSKKSGS